MEAKAFELASRAADGARVRLLWLYERNELLVEEYLTRTKETVYHTTPRDKGIDVFYHPNCGSYPAIVPDFTLDVTGGQLDAVALDGSVPELAQAESPQLADVDEPAPPASSAFGAHDLGISD
jgi:hypothetical protein